MLECILAKYAPFHLLFQNFEFDHNSTREHLDRDKCVMIGDRLDTDIAFGKNGKIKNFNGRNRLYINVKILRNPMPK